MPELSIEAKPLGGPASCPLCSETLESGGPVRECPGCAVGYHQECLDELGGCGTLGCPKATPRAGRLSARPRPRGGQGSPLLTSALVVLAVVLIVALAKSKSEDSGPGRARNFLEMREDQGGEDDSELPRAPSMSTSIADQIETKRFVTTIRSLASGDAPDTSHHELLMAEARRSYRNLLVNGSLGRAALNEVLLRELNAPSLSISDYAAARKIAQEVFLLEPR